MTDPHLIGTYVLAVLSGGFGFAALVLAFSEDSKDRSLWLFVVCALFAIAARL